MLLDKICLTSPRGGGGRLDNLVEAFSAEMIEETNGETRQSRFAENGQIVVKKRR